MDWDCPSRDKDDDDSSLINYLLDLCPVLACVRHVLKSG